FADRPTREQLRALVLEIRFDGGSRDDVWAPLGDFFGTAPGENAYASLPLGMGRDRYYCNWYMPFTQGAVIQVANGGAAVARLAHSVAREPLPADPGLRFHAKWRRDDPNTTFDWPFLEATGRGRFAGVAMTVWNPTPRWWGEGDEKVWVDGEG